MTGNNEVQKFIDEKKDLHEKLLSFLDNYDSFEYFDSLKDFINSKKYQENQEEMIFFLLLLANISDNHRRFDCFIQMIEKIILHYQDIIKQIFSYYEIFTIFQNNKILLLFLIKNQIITLDENICYELAHKEHFCHFFIPEIKSIIEEQNIESIDEKLLSIDSNDLDNYEEKRLEGENGSYICSLIRKDLAADFISFVTKTNFDLNSQISESIFETNQFLIETKNTTLIEYAAFFGSIKIFNYLLLNKAEITNRLWLYAIHSNNSNIIHLLEENKVPLPNDSYEKCLEEAIKCHHIDIANYFANNYPTKINEDVFSCILNYHNYSFFPYEFNQNYEFFYLCFFRYTTLVNLFIKKREKEIIHKISSFFL